MFTVKKSQNMSARDTRLAADGCADEVFSDESEIEQSDEELEAFLELAIGPLQPFRENDDADEMFIEHNEDIYGEDEDHAFPSAYNPDFDGSSSSDESSAYDEPRKGKRTRFIPPEGVLPYFL